MNGKSDLGGVAAMLAGTGSFVVCDSFMKLTTEALPPFEVLFLRGVAASLACAVLVAVRREGAAAARAFDPRALGRAACETVSVLCYIVALARMPIADVMAIVQIAPLMLILGASLFLRERIGALQIVLVLIGFAGALMVAQPASAGMSPAVLLAFASAAMMAARDLVGRGVPSHVPLTIVTLATNVMVMLAACAMSLGFETWTPPNGVHLAYLAAAGVFVTLGHAGLLLAYRLGRTITVAPFFYSFALWGVAAGLIVWGALPNRTALLGIVLIAASGVAIVLSQRDGKAIPLTEVL